jgi:hypothetical protein
MFGKAKFNLLMDITIFVAFVITAITGVFFWLFLPEGRGSSEMFFLGIPKSVWADVHDWAGVIMLSGAALHLTLHWKWIKCVGKRYFGKLARQARLNFTLNSLLFLAFIIVNLSGLIVWLVMPSGGYQGGRNPAYQMTLINLSRHTWNDIHLWSGLAMILVLIVHISLHWKWIACMLRRYTLETLCALHLEPAGLNR